MKTERDIRRVTHGQKVRQVELLLVGPDDEFKGNVVGRIFDEAGPGLPADQLFSAH